MHPGNTGAQLFENRRFAFVVLLGVLAVAAFLRFYNLGFPSVWIDELNPLYGARSYIESGEMTLPSGQPNERAYAYTVLVAWTFQIFGESPFALRFPGALLGVFCVLIAYFMASRFFGRTTAILTALFVAISPFAIGWSRISRFYTLFQLLFMAGIYLFYRGYEAKENGRLADLQKTIFEKIGLRKLLAILEKWRVNLFWILFSIPIFLFSFKIQSLTALFAAGLGLYALIMFIVAWNDDGFGAALRSKYAFTLSFFVLGGIVVLFAADTFLQYAMGYKPKWADMPKFQNKFLFFDFLFNHYQFPMGILFVLGTYRVFAQKHKPGLYAAALFIAPLILFATIFSYRHFQYLFNVYSLFTMIAAFAFAGFIEREFDTIKSRWFSSARWNATVVQFVILGIFLAWLPFAPSVRLARRIPFSDDGAFNGAMYMEEWREAGEHLTKNVRDGDLVISSDALGVMYYFGRVDYDLNFADYDLAKAENLIDENGEYFDNYSGAPFVKSLEHLRELMAANETVWLAIGEYKLMRASVFTPTEMKAHILKNFERTLRTRNGTVLVYKFQKPPPKTVVLEKDI